MVGLVLDYLRLAFIKLKASSIVPEPLSLACSPDSAVEFNWSADFGVPGFKTLGILDIFFLTVSTVLLCE